MKQSNNLDINFEFSRKQRISSGNFRRSPLQKYNNKGKYDDEH